MFLTDIAELQELRLRLAHYDEDIGEAFVEYIKGKYSLLYLIQITKFSNLADLESKPTKTLYEIALLKAIKENPGQFTSILKQAD